MKYIQNLPFILSSTIKRKIKKTLNLLFGSSVKCVDACRVERIALT